MIIVKILGFLILMSAVGWPIAHMKHHCPPTLEWDDSICPKAQQMELCMFLQFAVGGIMMVL